MSQILKLLMRYIPQLIRLIYVISSMYFVLRLVELEPDSRKYALELLHVLFSIFIACDSLKRLVSKDNNNSDIGDTD